MSIVSRKWITTSRTVCTDTYHYRNSMRHITTYPSEIFSRTKPQNKKWNCGSCQTMGGYSTIIFFCTESKEVRRRSIHVRRQCLEISLWNINMGYCTRITKNISSAILFAIKHVIMMLYRVYLFLFVILQWHWKQLDRNGKYSVLSDDPLQRLK